MNKRDYIAIAEVLKQHREGLVIARSLSEYFEKENPRFDREKFILASQYDPDIMIMGMDEFLDRVMQSGALDPERD